INARACRSDRTRHQSFGVHTRLNQLEGDYAMKRSLLFRARPRPCRRRRPSESSGRDRCPEKLFGFGPYSKSHRRGYRACSSCWKHWFSVSVLNAKPLTVEPNGTKGPHRKREALTSQPRLPDKDTLAMTGSFELRPYERS